MKSLSRLASIALIVCIICSNSCLPGVAENVLQLPSSLKVIEQDAFADDTSLERVVLPEDLERIEDGAFAGSSIQSINLPDSLQYISDTAFDKDADIEFTANEGTYAAYWLQDWENGGDTPEPFVSDFTFSNNGDGTCTVTGYVGDGTGDLVIPARNADGLPVTAIGDYAFYWTDGFTGRLVIPESVSTIGSRAFMGKSRLTGELILPDSITSIGEFAFYGCSGFRGELYIPDGLSMIKDYVFHGCSGLSGSLVIPNSVTSIGSDAFYGCSGFTGRLTIGKNVMRIGINAFAKCSGFSGNLVIPDSVTTIDENAFESCSGFTGSLTIGDGVTTIAANAFAMCSGFTGDLVIPDSVTTIGESAFVSCDGFTGTLTIGESVTSIGNSAFGGCRGFAGDLVIPDSVTTIGATAFIASGFTGNLTIGDGVTSIGESAFFGCYGLSGSLTIPDSVITIGENAFSSCMGLSGVLKIGRNVQTIGARAFSVDSNFSKIVIPDSVISMEEPFFGAEFDLRQNVEAVYCGFMSYAWQWFVDNDFEEKLVAWNGKGDPSNQAVELEIVRVTGHVATNTAMPLKGLYVLITDSGNVDRYWLLMTDSDGNWYADLPEGLSCTIDYLTSFYGFVDTAASFTAEENLILLATAVMQAGDETGITFTMKQNNRGLNNGDSIIVGSAVDFDVIVPEGATLIRLIVDSVPYESYVVNEEHTVLFTRVFSSSGMRQIQFRFFADDQWSSLSEPMMLQVISGGQLATPEIDAVEAHYVETALTITWNQVPNADSYTVYVYYGNSRVWPEYGKEISDARTSNTWFVIPADAFKVSGDYTIQVVTSGTVDEESGIGYDSSTGVLEPVTVYDTQEDVQLILLTDSENFGIGDKALFRLYSSYKQPVYSVRIDGIEFGDDQTHYALSESSETEFSYKMLKAGDYSFTPIVVSGNETHEGIPVTIKIEEPSAKSFTVNNHYKYYCWLMNDSEVQITVRTNCSLDRVELMDGGQKVGELQNTGAHMYSAMLKLGEPGEKHEYSIVGIYGGNTYTLSDHSILVYSIAENHLNNTKAMIKENGVLLDYPDHVSTVIPTAQSVLTIKNGVFNDLYMVEYGGKEYFVNKNSLVLDYDTTNAIASISTEAEVVVETGSTIAYMLKFSEGVSGVDVKVRFTPCTEYSKYPQNVNESIIHWLTEVSTAEVYSFEYTVPLLGKYEFEFIPISNTGTSESSSPRTHIAIDYEAEQRTMYLKKDETHYVYRIPEASSSQALGSIYYTTPIEVLGDAGSGWSYVRSMKDSVTGFIRYDDMGYVMNVTKKRAYVIVSEWITEERPNFYCDNWQSVLYSCMELGYECDAGYRSTTRKMLVGLFENLASMVDFNDETLIYIFAHGSEGYPDLITGESFGHPEVKYKVQSRSIQLDVSNDKSTWMYHYEIMDYLSRIQGKIILMTDSCHDGGLTDAAKFFEANNWIDNNGIVIVTAGTEQDATSGLASSSFLAITAEYVQLAIMRNKSGYYLADASEDGKVSLGEFIAFRSKLQSEGLNWLSDQLGEIFDKFMNTAGYYITGKTKTIRHFEFNTYGDHNTTLFE